MRTDCRHYSRRTGAGGEVTEACGVGAAPDAPLRCPVDCPQFERRKLSTVAFEYGSLTDARTGPADVSGPGDVDAGDEALFAELRGVLDGVADDAVTAEAERRRADETRKRRARRKRLR